MNLRNKTKFFLTMTLFMSLFMALASCVANPEFNTDEKTFLKTNVTAIMESIVEEGYTFKLHSSQQYLVFVSELYPTTEFRIYSPNSLGLAHAVTFRILLDEKTANVDRATKDKAPLNAQTVALLKRALVSLNCSHEKDFMKSGFRCNDEYKVVYKVYEDAFNNLREKLGIVKNIQVMVSVEPL